LLRSTAIVVVQAYLNTHVQARQEHVFASTIGQLTKINWLKYCPRPLCCWDNNCGLAEEPRSTGCCSSSNNAACAQWHGKIAGPTSHLCRRPTAVTIDDERNSGTAGGRANGVIPAGSFDSTGWDDSTGEQSTDDAGSRASGTQRSKQESGTCLHFWMLRLRQD